MAQPSSSKTRLSVEKHVIVTQHPEGELYGTLGATARFEAAKRTFSPVSQAPDLHGDSTYFGYTTQTKCTTKALALALYAKTNAFSGRMSVRGQYLVNGQRGPFREGASSQTEMAASAVLTYLDQAHIIFNGSGAFPVGDLSWAVKKSGASLMVGSSDKLVPLTTVPFVKGALPDPYVPFVGLLAGAQELPDGVTEKFRVNASNPAKNRRSFNLPFTRLPAPGDDGTMLFVTGEWVFSSSPETFAALFGMLDYLKQQDTVPSQETVVDKANQIHFWIDRWASTYWSLHANMSPGHLKYILQPGLRSQTSDKPVNLRIFRGEGSKVVKFELGLQPQGLLSMIESGDDYMPKPYELGRGYSIAVDVRRNHLALMHGGDLVQRWLPSKPLPIDVRQIILAFASKAGAPNHWMQRWTDAATKVDELAAESVEAEEPVAAAG